MLSAAGFSGSVRVHLRRTVLGEDSGHIVLGERKSLPDWVMDSGEEYLPGICAFC
ncbi:MAG: hypothetical protein QOG67_51 [Verrucomicrobiota bacterium]|jgi:hypothetical protein